MKVYLWFFWELRYKHECWFAVAPRTVWVMNGSEYYMRACIKKSMLSVFIRWAYNKIVMICSNTCYRVQGCCVFAPCRRCIPTTGGCGTPCLRFCPRILLEAETNGIDLGGQEGILYPIILGNKGDWSYLVYSRSLAHMFWFLSCLFFQSTLFGFKGCFFNYIIYIVFLGAA